MHREDVKALRESLEVRGVKELELGLALDAWMPQLTRHMAAKHEQGADADVMEEDGDEEAAPVRKARETRVPTGTRRTRNAVAAAEAEEAEAKLPEVPADLARLPAAAVAARSFALSLLFSEGLLQSQLLAAPISGWSSAGADGTVAEAWREKVLTSSESAQDVDGSIAQLKECLLQIEEALYAVQRAEWIKLFEEERADDEEQEGGTSSTAAPADRIQALGMVHCEGWSDGELDSDDDTAAAAAQPAKQSDSRSKDDAKDDDDDEDEDDDDEIDYEGVEHNVWKTRAMRRTWRRAVRRCETVPALAISHLELHQRASAAGFGASMPVLSESTYSHTPSDHAPILSLQARCGLLDGGVRSCIVVSCPPTPFIVPAVHTVL